jgi:hypothetical protein
MGVGDKNGKLATAARESRVGELAVYSIFPIYIECGVDREVHATAGQEAGATGWGGWGYGTAEAAP